MKLKLFSVVFLSFFISACVVHQAPPPDQGADKLTVGKVQGEIKVGLPASDVVAVLGSPNMVMTDGERREVWTYDKISTERTDARSSSYGTLIILGASQRTSSSSTVQKTLTIIIYFDKDKKVRDFAYNYTQF
jgi:outer membrane protein assembly factor BamE (lipoprotein component of BamABCDE complex)